MKIQRILAITVVCVVVLMSATAMAADAVNNIEPDYYVYGTPEGKFYHTDSSCSGMRNASIFPLLAMIEEGRPACPICCPEADMIVYGKSGNPYFHSNSECLGIKNVYAGTLEKALAFGLKKCPKCWED